MDDDGYDFPPAAHPVREVLTFSACVIVIAALAAWAVYRIFVAG
jgi:hypothetical protein